jgi:hypothetical protein
MVNPIVARFGELSPYDHDLVPALWDAKFGSLEDPVTCYMISAKRYALFNRYGDTVDVRKVKVAERVGSLWIISEGLKPGERVIVEGIDKVRSGEKVKPLPADPEPQGQAANPAAAPAPASPAAPRPGADSSGWQPASR